MQEDSVLRVTDGVEFVLPIPVRYVIHKELCLIMTVAEGRVTFDEAKAHQERLLKDPNFDRDFNELIDVTNASGLDLSSEQLRSLSLSIPFVTKARRAIVASRPAEFGVGRMYQAHYEKQHKEVSVFYDRDQALKWLGVPEDSGLF